MKLSPKHIIWLTIFSIAMGFLETAVVVYLRIIYYPNGFQFPLSPINANVALTEFLREAATLIMLWGIGWFAGKTPVQRFAFFLYSFAIWDIFYYVFLYLLLGWPESLFTWDVLFLIPVTWVGPVLAPCLVACTMIVFTSIVVWLSANDNDRPIRIPKSIIWMWLIGCVIIIGSFIYDYVSFVQQHHGLSALWSPGKQEALFAEIAVYTPTYYPWWIFAFGELFLLGGIVQFYIFNKHPKNQPKQNAQPNLNLTTKQTVPASETFADEWESL